MPKKKSRASIKRKLGARFTEKEGAAFERGGGISKRLRTKAGASLTEKEGRVARKARFTQRKKGK